MSATRCPTEWVDESGEQHCCVRSDGLHKRDHACGCGATIPHIVPVDEAFRSSRVRRGVSGG